MVVSGVTHSSVDIFLIASTRNVINEFVGRFFRCEIDRVRGDDINEFILL